MGFLTVFRKKKSQPLSVDVVQSTALVAPGGGRQNVLARHGVRSLLDHGMSIEGNLRSERGAAIDGIVNGDVTVSEPNSALLLRSSALVRGVVRAPIVMVSGTVEGSIEARFVRLFPGSKVIGRIHAVRLVVDDGAQIINDDVGAGLLLEATAARVTPPAAAAPAQTDPAATAVPPATSRPSAAQSETWQDTLRMQPPQGQVGAALASLLRAAAE